MLFFLKASVILNVKVVPNDIFKFGGERVNHWTLTCGFEAAFYCAFKVIDLSGLIR